MVTDAGWSQYEQVAMPVSLEGRARAQLYQLAHVSRPSAAPRCALLHIAVRDAPLQWGLMKTFLFLRN